MDEIKRILRCYKCGAILQDENPDEVGFINSDILLSVFSSFPICIKRHIVYYKI